MSFEVKDAEIALPKHSFDAKHKFSSHLNAEICYHTRWRLKTKILLFWALFSDGDLLTKLGLDQPKEAKSADQTQFKVSFPPHRPPLIPISSASLKTGLRWAGSLFSIYAWPVPEKPFSPPPVTKPRLVWRGPSPIKRNEQHGKKNFRNRARN